MERKIFLTACSNGRPQEKRPQVERLRAFLKDMGWETEESSCMYCVSGGATAAAQERARALMDFYGREEGEWICDVSGGDLANGVLPYLDFGKIKDGGKLFWGYSDLTCILNGIYTRTGRASVLYQLMNLAGPDGEGQRRRFLESPEPGKGPLYEITVRFLQGSRMEGILLGGNVRCLLKLAGTPWWPDFSGKLLLLESLGGGEARIQSYFDQLQQLGVFRQASGVLLGTFTEMEREICRGKEALTGQGSAGAAGRRAWELLLPLLPEGLPLAATEQIGHGPDSRAAVIGGWMKLEG